MHPLICALDHKSMDRATLWGCLNCSFTFSSIDLVFSCRSFVDRCFWLRTVYLGSANLRRSWNSALSITWNGRRFPARNIRTASVIFSCLGSVTSFFFGCFGLTKWEILACFSSSFPALVYSLKASCFL